MSARQYARHRGCDHKAVTLAIRDGRLVRSVLPQKGGAMQILASVADQEWAANTDPAQSRSRSKDGEQDSGLEYRKSLIVQKVVQTQLAQLELEERQGRLLDSKTVLATQFEIARMVSQQFIQMVDRICDEVAQETNALRVRDMLLTEVREVLRKMADRLERRE